ncbi:MAG: XRE family transcriptional regulator [Bifidobacterium scardovii]|uniref:XRE family transcriptional regulator n=1 Tax=Bifidobacterium scardovii TaxID=158787 RepID=UPI0028FE1368|nr:XRE family transcriptional regulator [Bifidobacterium scardovii]MDU2421436.1 XRE family transcriptional regulator [Bifidobacterium scardovii]
MATGSKKPTVESKALSIAIKRAMATRDLKTPGLASASTIPYGTLRKILELNTVADYEQLRKIAVALNIPLSEIVEDAERLASDPGVVDDFRESASSDTSKSPVVDEQSPEANHEDIDIDAWANRIKAEDSVHNN